MKKPSLIKIISLQIIIFTVMIITVASIQSCSMFVKPPERLAGEPEECYEYRYCKYLAAKGKVVSDCGVEFDRCCKKRNYIFCQDSNNLWPDDKPQNCWDKLQ